MSLARRGQRGRSPASTGTPTFPARTCARGAAPSSLSRTPSSTPTAGGPASPRPLKAHQSKRPSTAACSWNGPRSPAPTVAATSATSSTTDRTRLGFATASTRRRSSSTQSSEQLFDDRAGFLGLPGLVGVAERNRPLHVHVDASAEGASAGQDPERQLEHPALHGLVARHAQRVTERGLDPDEAWRPPLLR